MKRDRYGCQAMRTVTSMNVKWKEGPKDTSSDIPTQSLKIAKEKSGCVGKDSLELLTLLLPLGVLRSQVCAVLPSVWRAGHFVTEPHLQPQCTVCS